MAFPRISSIARFLAKANLYPLRGTKLLRDKPFAQSIAVGYRAHRNKVLASAGFNADCVSR
jgi:hypothetical protein